MSEKLINKLPKVQGEYRENAKIKNWFGVGGNAEILYRPQDIADLQFFLKNCPKDIPVNILGVGSNVIIGDDGIKGVLINLTSEFAKISHHKNIINAGASALCSSVATYSKNYALSNLEFLNSIPGSIGGAIAMNAGCYESDISKVLIKAMVIDYDGNLTELSLEDFGFEYRKNNLSKNYIFLSAFFKTKESTSQIVSEKIEKFNQNRQNSQPIRAKTGGSTFKNPKNSNKKAWQLIDEIGYRGFKKGDAQISEKHCNFMINTGNAKAKDLIELGEEVKKKVKEKFEIELEWEIKIFNK